MKRLRDFWLKHPDAELPLRNWYKTTVKASWSNIAEVREIFPHADAVKLDSGIVLTVFNVRGNNYRLICEIQYKYFHIYVRRVMTHKEYDAGL